MAIALAACGGGGGGGNDIGGGGNGGGNGGGSNGDGNGGGGNGDGNGDGNGNGDGPPPIVTAQSIAGVVVDGYIVGATLRCISDGTALATTTSGAAGAYAFNLGADQACDTIESQGGIDVGTQLNSASDDRVAPAGITRAPVPTGAAAVTSLVVSPLSTLVQALVDGGTAADEAQAQVRTALGLSPSLDLLATDPVSDVSLFKANAVIAQVVEQIGNALGGVAGINDAAGRAALADAAFQAVAAQLDAIDMAGLVPANGSLTPDSPLFGLVEQAATNAKADSTLASALQGVDPTTFAAIATPLVASATNGVNDGATADDVALHGVWINEQGRSASVLASLAGVVGEPADDPQDVLNTVGTALNASGGGADTPFSLTINGQTASATVPGRLGNYALLRDDELQLRTPSGSTTVTISDFFSDTGVTVSQELSALGFGLDASPGNAQLSDTPIEVPMAIEVKDANRVFQAIIDRVALAADDSGRVHASLPEGAKLFAYGKTGSTETTAPVEATLAGIGLQIVSTDGAGVISYSFDRLFETLAPVAAGGPLASLVQNRVSSGSYDVTMVIGTLRAAYGSSPGAGGTAFLGALETVNLGAGGPSVSGHGFKGKVAVAP